jgi:hypothetical protein
MPEHDGLQGERLVERGPPEDNKPKRRPRRPAEFSPAGARGDDPITRNLKRVYAEVAAEPIPPDLMQLLNQLSLPEGSPQTGTGLSNGADPEKKEGDDG